MPEPRVRCTATSPERPLQPSLDGVGSSAMLPSAPPAGARLIATAPSAASIAIAAAGSPSTVQPLQRSLPCQSPTQLAQLACVATGIGSADAAMPASSVTSGTHRTTRACHDEPYSSASIGVRGLPRDVAR